MIFTTKDDVKLEMNTVADIICFFRLNPNEELGLTNESGYVILRAEVDERWHTNAIHGKNVIPATMGDTLNVDKDLCVDELRIQCSVTCKNHMLLVKSGQYASLNIYRDVKHSNISLSPDTAFDTAMWLLSYHERYKDASND